MSRFAFENMFGLAGLNIAWYGLIIAGGLALGVLLVMHRAKQRRLNSDMILDFLVYAVPLAIIGARLYYIVFEWGSYADDLSKIFAFNEGGLAIYGAVLGGLLAAAIFSKVKKFPLLTLLDLLILSIAF